MTIKEEGDCHGLRGKPRNDYLLLSHCEERSDESIFGEQGMRLTLYVK